ncbi:hypothetical protein AOQ72_03755 [Bradyrhizobium yuanmingense]|uniref:Uncharacterized protein n=1 Tax=Bradyrhizobium yuanmingense TaxID=108015 RepID=A0A0R3BRM1_9BRAD|nr:hypothetical protein AOQ72_03755 [Bradyrhizobium yuanmingense]
MRPLARSAGLARACQIASHQVLFFVQIVRARSIDEMEIRLIPLARRANIAPPAKWEDERDVTIGGPLGSGRSAGMHEVITHHQPKLVLDWDGIGRRLGPGGAALEGAAEVSCITFAVAHLVPRLAMVLSPFLRMS